MPCHQQSQRESARNRAAGHKVFSPVEVDRKVYGEDFGSSNPSGCPEQAVRDFGFDRRAALAADLAFICRKAEGVVVLPAWRRSTGVKAEIATAVALGLKIIYLDEPKAKKRPARSVRARSRGKVTQAHCSSGVTLVG
jgi:hypothetical protein